MAIGPNPIDRRNEMDAHYVFLSDGKPADDPTHVEACVETDIPCDLSLWQLNHDDDVTVLIEYIQTDDEGA